jgi:hypothetical protein
MSAGARQRPRSAPERYLTLWVALCILTGIVLGRLLPAPFPALGRMTVAEVNIAVAVLIWLMIVPFRSGWDHEFESTRRCYGAGGEDVATSSLHEPMECRDAPAERPEQVPRRPGPK